MQTAISVEAARPHQNDSAGEPRAPGAQCKCARDLTSIGVGHVPYLVADEHDDEVLPLLADVRYVKLLQVGPQVSRIVWNYITLRRTRDPGRTAHGGV